jgi:hypothetical protein
MSVKLSVGLLILALLAGLGWYYRDNPELRRLLHLEQPAAPFNGANQSGAAPGPAAAGLHKCRSGAKLTYTNEACPKGSAEQPITGGAVTVVPGQPPAAPTKSDTPPDDANLSKRAMEKLIGK